MTEQFIKNEQTAIREDFEKAFYCLLPVVPYLREMTALLKSSAMKAGDKQAVKNANQLSVPLNNMAFAVEQFESKFKTENNKSKEKIRAALKERIWIFSLALARLPFEMHADLIAHLQDYYQGNFKYVSGEMLDALLEHENENGIEGLALVHRINPSLTPEQKEEFAKEMMQWSDYRNIRKNANSCTTSSHS